MMDPTKRMRMEVMLPFIYSPIHWNTEESRRLTTDYVVQAVSSAGPEYRGESNSVAIFRFVCPGSLE